MFLLSSLFFTTAYSACNANEYMGPTPEVSISCNAVTNENHDVNLTPGSETLIAMLPAGTSDITISMESLQGDLDLCLWDQHHNSCAHGNLDCLVGHRCAKIGGNGGTASYQGVTLSYPTGDDNTPPDVKETITITGTLQEDMHLTVVAYRRWDNQAVPYDGQVTLSHGGIANCPTTPNNCLPCDHHECPDGQHPTCDGTTARCVTSWTAPTCGFFGDGSWSHSQIGYEKRNPTSATGGVGPFTFEAPSNGCCADRVSRSYPDWEMWCQSTGDPHIKQFNHATNHAYINGDYLLYKGNHLSLAVRHMNQGNVAGNGAFVLQWDGVKLEFYDKHIAYGNQPQKAAVEILLNGQAADGSGAAWTYTSACAYITGGNHACACQWTDGVLYILINDSTMFKMQRWATQRGWNNIYLQVDPEDKSPSDTGMCTSSATTNNEGMAGKPHVDPYPESRLTCANDVFTRRAGVDSHGTQHTDYYCLPATDMRRMAGYPVMERRRFGQVLESCMTTHRDMVLKAFTICEPCQSDDYDMEVCLMDACLMKEMDPSMTDDQAAEMSIGQAEGCTEERMAAVEPSARATSCSAGTTWSERYQTCLAEFHVKPTMMCSGTKHPISGTYLNDCQSDCERDVTCKAFVHDATMNECSLFTVCNLTPSGSKNIVTYMKVDSVASVIAAGEGLEGTDDDVMEGPHASYGNPTSQGSGDSSLPGPLHEINFDDVQDQVDDVHTDVEDLGDSVKELHDSLEESVTDLHEEITDMHEEMEESLTDLHDELEDSLKDLHDDLEEEVNNLNEDLNDGLDEAHEAVNEIRAALAELHSATAYAAGQPMAQPAPVPIGGYPAPATYTGQTMPTNYGGAGGAPTNYGGPATQNTDNDDETAWKTVAIVSMVLTALLICGAFICVVGYIGCMLKK